MAGIVESGVAKKRLETVYDVAKAAGVSVATVSRVLNNYPNVSEKTRERVLSMISRSGFRPNANARRLVGGQSGQICFLVSNRGVVNSFHSRILIGAEEYCRAHHYHVVFTTVEYDQDHQFPGSSLPRVIHEHGGVDGVLLAGVNYPPMLEYLERVNIRYVLFGNNLVTGSLALPAAHAVSFDEAQGGEQAASLLVELGHQQITFVGDLSRSWYRRRYDGFRRVMRAKRLAPAVIDFRGEASAFELGSRAVPQLLREHPKTTAIVAQDDEAACGILHTLQRVGLRTPEDISVVGYDDINEIRYLNPALTTVRVPKEKIGWTMADQLLGEQTRTGAIVLPTELVIRDSCRKLSEKVKTVSLFS